MKAFRITVYLVCLLFPLSCGEKEAPAGQEGAPLVPEGEYVPVGKPDIKDDIKVKVLSGTASSWQPGANIEKSFDGSYETIYHSSWNNSAGGYFPVTLTYSFSKGTDIDYLVYHPRKSGNNGNFRETEIRYKIRGKEWSAAEEYNFKGSGHPSKVEFRATLKDVESIRFKSMDKGLLYVVFQSDDHQTAKPVKVHFAGGRVNGLFDLRRHKDSDWKRLLGAAEYPFFDVVGEYSHLTFPTSRFRSHTPDGAALVRAYDSFVRAEQELMGLFRYFRTFPNRMRFIVIYTSYMYATSYYTAYNDSTLPLLCDVRSLTTGSCWGPAHEVGHCNQTRPGLKWLGTTEVTNNIMSEYVQTTILRQPSRLQTEDMGNGLPNRYAKAWRDILAAGAPHSTEGDVFCKLVPFWQLQLYFGEVLGQTPELRDDKGGFYPDVFEHVRTAPDLWSPSEQQTEFVLTCSKASGHNLLDFFTKWGFLTPVDARIDDYGSGRMTVTESRIEEIRHKVEALGLPAPDAPIEYITDNNKSLFKTRPEVIPGSVSVSPSGTVTLTDWKNVVVFEVTDADGGLVFASEGKLFPSSRAVFTIPGGWNPSYRILAVSATGKRTEVRL